MIEVEKEFAFLSPFMVLQLGDQLGLTKERPMKMPKPASAPILEIIFQHWRFHRERGRSDKVFILNYSELFHDPHLILPILMKPHGILSLV